MKINPLIFAAITLLASCVHHDPLNDEIRKTIGAQKVSFTDSTLHQSNATGSLRLINIDLGDRNPTGAEVLKDAYLTANMAYRNDVSENNKMPEYYKINVKAVGKTQADYGYKTSYLAKTPEIENHIKAFMDRLVRKQYDQLKPLVEPSLDISSITDLFKKADVQGDGINSYQFIALRHGMGERPSDHQPIPVIEGWVYIFTPKSKNPNLMLFIADPLANFQIASIYLNPDKQQ